MTSVAHDLAPMLATASPTSPAPSGRPPLSPSLLLRALHDEQAVLEDLVQTLERQRDAVAHDDLDAVNASVFAAHRLLAAYREARDRRRRAVRVTCGGGDGRIDDLPLALGEEYSEAERHATLSLRGTAQRLVAAVERNRHLLQQAMASGEAFLQLLSGGAPVHDASGYTPRPRGAATPAAPRLVDLRG